MTARLPALFAALWWAVVLLVRVAVFFGCRAPGSVFLRLDRCRGCSVRIDDRGRVVARGHGLVPARQWRTPSRQSCIRHCLSDASVAAHGSWYGSTGNDHRWCGGKRSKCSRAITGAHLDRRLHGDICQPRPARRSAASETPGSCILRPSELDAHSWRIRPAGISGFQRRKYRRPCPCVGLCLGSRGGVAACKVGPRLDH